MPKVSAPIYSLNGGEVGKEALARLDLERMQFAGSLYSNTLPRVIGSMTLRPGLEHITNINFGDVQLLEYSYSGGSTLVPILSNGAMRVVKDRTLVARAAVSTAITNGNFGSFTGWTDASPGAASASVSGGDLVLVSVPFARASAKQTISVALADRNVEHGLRIKVKRGPVMVKLGSTAGAQDLIRAAQLDDGDHSIAFTPTTASIFLEIYHELARTQVVDSCNIDAAGTLALDAPWTSADITDHLVKYEQSIDVMYVASSVYQQREIQRRSDTGWGIQRYKSDDGPFVSFGGTIALNPNVFTGNGTLTASQPYFTPQMVGRLFRLVQNGQTVDTTFTSDPASGAHIRVSGVGAARRFNYQTGGTWTGTVRLQVATDDGSGNPAGWVDVLTLTSNVLASYTDPDDNVIKFFRFALNPGDFGSGSIGTQLSYSGGSQTGIARMIGYTSETVAQIEVVERFFSLTATSEWDYSTWSDEDGWPAAVEVFGGRLYWGKGDLINGSVPDAFKSFSDEIEGDSAPIARSVNSNSQRGILWLLGLQRLIAGTDVAEISIKASSFDEPLRADSWFPVDASTRGSFNIRPLKTDTDGIFVQSSGTGAFRLTRDQQGVDYASSDLMQMHELICDGFEIVDLAVQRKPDTVLWFILANGEARALTYEPGQSVVAWSRVVTDGLFKRVAASRGAGQDAVYFAVSRGGTLRLERMADLADCKGGVANCLADAFTRFDLVSPQTTFSVPHLNGEQVTVWVDGAAVHSQSNLYTVTGNQVVLSTAATQAVVIGLPYSGRFKSTKLAYGAASGSALFRKKRIPLLGMYLTDTMLDGLRIGRSFDDMKRFTTTKNDKPIPANYLFDEFDADLMAISNDWDTDSRICLEAQSPYPFTASALVMEVATNG